MGETGGADGEIEEEWRRRGCGSRRGRRKTRGRAVPCDSLESEVRAYSGSQGNIPLEGMGGFWRFATTKHKNMGQAWDGPVTFHPVTRTKHTHSVQKLVFESDCVVVVN